jgi:hypothetical protein
LALGGFVGGLFGMRFWDLGFCDFSSSDFQIRDGRAHVTGGYNGQLSTLQWAHAALDAPDIAPLFDPTSRCS